VLSRAHRPHAERSPSSSPGLEELWEEYPLDPPETQPPVQPETVEEPASTALPPRATEDGASVWGLALGAGIGACVVLLTAGALVARSRRETATPTPRPETPDELMAHAYALAKAAAECEKYVHGQRDEGTSVMTGTSDHDLSDAPDLASQPTIGSYADIGERVAGVLAAAETAATQIREDARASADARRRGQALRDESHAVEERLKKAAQGLRRMTGEIEELLGAPSGDGESLTDALKPYSQRPELPVSAAPSDDR
jgi:hypothetical protein